MQQIAKAESSNMARSTAQTFHEQLTNINPVIRKIIDLLVLRGKRVLQHCPENHVYKQKWLDDLNATRTLGDYPAFVMLCRVSGEMAFGISKDNGTKVPKINHPAAKSFNAFVFKFFNKFYYKKVA